MSGSPRLQFTLRYLAILAPASLLWEFAHMPLYTLWLEGTTWEIVYAGVHCTGGDVLIGAAALFLGFSLFGGSDWPRRRAVVVALAAIAFGLAYTVFSEWLNITLRQSWAYRDIMPRVPFLGTGLSPLLQWLVIPAMAYAWAWKLQAGSHRNLKGST